MAWHSSLLWGLSCWLRPVAQAGQAQRILEEGHRTKVASAPTDASHDISPQPCASRPRIKNLFPRLFSLADALASLAAAAYTPICSLAVSGQSLGYPVTSFAVRTAFGRQ